MENPQASLAHQFEELKRLQEATKKESDNALKQIEELHRTKGGVINYTEFSRAELEVATKNFDKSLVIGKGGFATVYKGFLRHTTVAIKILNPEKYQGNIEEGFNLEVEILTKVRHPNLVLLIGSSMEAWALIYEFLPNSLDAYLNNEPGRQKFSWQNRIRIASEICSALIFLHSVGKNGIAHGDLKPQNILLDSSFVSKIIDFGISRELNKSDETLTPIHVTKIPKYTPAYADPEFFSTGELTPHCDVYSYGIILLQLVTGRGPHKIRYYVEDILENGKLDKLVDRSAGNWPIEEARKLAFLGLGCIDQSRKKRPELASEVWVQIESMKDADYKFPFENSLEEKAKPEFQVPESNTSLEMQIKNSLEAKNKYEHQLAEANTLLEITRKKLEEIERGAEEKTAEGGFSHELTICSAGGFSREVTIFSSAELAAATNDYTESLKIGEGSRSSVYKGFLRYTTVSIKIFKHESQEFELQNKKFSEQVEILGKVNHPNIILLIGVNLEAPALVYDYLSNGSLQTYLLYGKNTKKLRRQDRIRIASEICSALIFLHSRGIAHGNLKPENVLLDSNLVSKLSGFSGARNLKPSEDTMSPNHVTARPGGLLAYIDPEYLAFGELTQQSDVFSFGIILLQLVTGKDPRGLRSYVEIAVDGYEDGKRLDKFLDSSAGKWPIEEAMKMAELGLACSHQMRRHRASLTDDVWKALEDMKQGATTSRGSSKWF